MKDFLQVAARSGSGNAARALGSGLAGMRTRTRRLLIFGGVVVFLVYLGWDLLAGMTTLEHETSVPVTTARGATEETSRPAPTPVSGSSVVSSTSDTVTYAVDVDEVAGLAPSASPGTVLDIWVAWDRTITKTPDLQRLLRGVVLEQVAPPVTADGPYVAIFSVAQDRVHRLLWGDRYGTLSATTAPPG